MRPQLLRFPPLQKHPLETPQQNIFACSEDRGEVSVTKFQVVLQRKELRWQTSPKRRRLRKTADFADSTPSPGNWSIWSAQEAAENRRFSQQTAGNRRLASVALDPSPLARPQNLIRNLFVILFGLSVSLEIWNLQPRLSQNSKSLTTHTPLIRGMGVSPP